MGEYRDVPCYTTAPTQATFNSRDKLALFTMSNNVTQYVMAVSTLLPPVYCFRVGNAAMPTFYVVSTSAGVKAYYSYFQEYSLSTTRTIGDTTYYYTYSYWNAGVYLPYTFYFGYYDTLDDGLNDIARGNLYPITYRNTNCSTSSAPVEAVVGDTVTVQYTFPEGYGIVNPSSDIYVTNNGVVVPSSYANGMLTFTMPDPSQ